MGRLTLKWAAGDIETIVLDRLRKFFTSQAEILDAFGDDVGHSAPQWRLSNARARLLTILAPKRLKRLE
jgi:hypothetical protein